MRIVIDMQGAQLAADNDTVDEASIAFVKGLAEEQANHEIFLALSGLYPNTVEPVRAALDGVLPQENIRLWYAPENNGQVAAIIREAFLLHLQPDIVHFVNFNHPQSLHLTAKKLLGGNKKPLTMQLMHRTGSEISEDENLYCHDLSEIFADGDKPDWTSIAHKTIAVWTELQDNFKPVSQLNNTSGSKPRLAYVSPLPPERTGIADYSAELLPALAEFYDIELIINQKTVEDQWINNNLNVRDVAWFRENVHQLDRVVYHFGNSYFHVHMLELLREIPGVVVLHDFFIGHLMAWAQENYKDNTWINALKESHGWQGLKVYAESPERAVFDYPANLEVLRNAYSVIFHSQYAKNLVIEWYGNAYDQKLHVVPLARKAAEERNNKTTARKKLGLKRSSFVVCAYGFMGETKLNHLLLDAWTLCSEEFQREAELIFVGDCPNNLYGQELQEKISKMKSSEVTIAGYTAAEKYRMYLESADLAVQLRTKSRGETSASVLDCMSYALPVIINSNGSMSEFDNNAALILDDEFRVNELAEAIESLWQKPEKRYELGGTAKKIILEKHTPRVCAELYTNVIEETYASAFKESETVEQLAEKLIEKTPQEVAEVADCFSKTFQKETVHNKKIFVDVSAICINDLGTGIQRVVKAILLEMLENPPNGYAIEPVFLSNTAGRWHFRSADNFYTKIVNQDANWQIDDTAVDMNAGDILLGLDFSGGYLAEADRYGDLVTRMRSHGVYLTAVVYDILPIRLPEVFPTESKEHHEKWADVIAKFDGAIAISKTVADDFSRWLKETNKNYQNRRPYKVDWFYLGADIDSSIPTKGIPEQGHEILEQLNSEITFLMVGTIEPRKGYLEVLEAFTQMWGNGLNVNLVIVGREGWTHLPDEKRKTIPETVKSIREHKELNKKLFWLDGISDEYLEKVYKSASVLIAASYGEGFGLPLIEAAQHGLPIIARDIPVFREVAGDNAFYFSESSNELVQSIYEWIELYQQDRHPMSSEMTWMSWKDSANQLIQRLI